MEIDHSLFLVVLLNRKSQLSDLQPPNLGKITTFPLHRKIRSPRRINYALQYFPNIFGSSHHIKMWIFVGH